MNEIVEESLSVRRISYTRAGHSRALWGSSLIQECVDLSSALGRCELSRRRLDCLLKVVTVTAPKELPAVICGMAGLNRDERAAAGCGHLVVRNYFPLNDGPIVA